MHASARPPPVSSASPRPARWLARRWRPLAGLLAVLIGLMAMVGWAIGSVTLIAGQPGQPAMQPMTAIGTMLGGTGLWGLAVGKPRWALFGVPIGLIGLATLYQYAGGGDLGIDRLLFARVIDNQPWLYPAPGRMAESSALLFVMLALALVLAARGGRSARLGLWLATAGVTVGAIVITGYVTGNGAFRAAGLLVEMALPTAISLTVMFAALASLATAPQAARSARTATAAQRAITALAPLRRLPLWLRVSGGVAVPVAAFAARELLGGFIGLSPMVQFVPAVVLAAFLFGPGAGIISVLVSTVLGRFLFVPFGSLAVAAPRDEAVLLLFMIIFLIVTAAIDLMFSTIERAQADADALRRQASLIDQSRDAILAWELDGTIIYWSRGAAALYGHSADAVMGQDVHRLLATQPPEQRTEMAARLARDGTWIGELVYRASDGRQLTVETRLAQVRDSNGRQVVLETSRDLTAKRAAERRAANVELQMAAILDALPIGILVSEMPSGRIVLANPAVEAIFRHPVPDTPDVAAYRIWESYHADGRRVEAEDYPLGRVLATGQRAEGEYRYRRGDGTDAWVRIVGAPIRDVDGALVGGVVGIVDIDEEKRLVEHQQLLMAELSHRVKNMLAVVQGIASSTMRRSASLEDFSLAFEGRLQALSTAHTQLLRTDWRGAQLHGLAEAVLAPHAAGDRLTIAGADVALDARQGVALALVLHELATNAARHGALSTPAGRIRIHWDVLPGDSGVPRLQLCWAEAGLVTPPAIGGDGLGMRLITRSVEGDLGGRIDLQPGAEGLSWIMTFDLEPIPDAARGE